MIAEEEEAGMMMFWWRRRSRRRRAAAGEGAGVPCAPEGIRRTAWGRRSRGQEKFTSRDAARERRWVPGGGTLRNGRGRWCCG
jgi:hypothetical protein